jgi:hypothetical protein
MVAGFVPAFFYSAVRALPLHCTGDVAYENPHFHKRKIDSRQRIGNRSRETITLPSREIVYRGEWLSY